MAIGNLTASATVQLGWTAQNSLTGTDYSPTQQSSTIRKLQTHGTAVANAGVGGGDELYSAISSISASGTVSIDLTAITDILSQAGISLARVKFIMLRLLSVADDATNGTAASSVTLDNTVANALSAQAHSGWFDNGSEGAVGGSKFTVPNGAGLIFMLPNAAGVVVDGTHKVIKAVNNDGSLTAKLQLSVMGGST